MDLHFICGFVLSCERSEQKRETGWSPIYCRRRYLRGVVPSKVLLLHGVIRDDNSANNGGILNNFMVVDNTNRFGP